VKVLSIDICLANQPVNHTGTKCEGLVFKEMVSYKRMVVVAMAVTVLVIIWVQFEYVYSSSNDCTMVSEVLESCYNALQSGMFFMDAESVCCMSLDNLENRTRKHELTRYAFVDASTSLITINRFFSKTIFWKLRLYAALMLLT
jgi:hypothetical protein